jgi:hypothetical protein
LSIVSLHEYCVTSLSQSFSYESLSFVNNHFTHVAFDLARALVTSHGGGVPLGRAAWTPYGRRIRDAGFVDVVERHFYWPLNMWPPGKEEKLIGTWAQQNLLNGVEAMSMDGIADAGAELVDGAGRGVSGGS